MLNNNANVLKLYEKKLLQPNDKGINYASQVLHTGGLVAFPTETVYGLGANALDETAVNSIFVAKGRPLTDPLIVHVATKEQGRSLLDLSDVENDIYEILSTSFWPGKVSISIYNLLLTSL